MGESPRSTIFPPAHSLSRSPHDLPSSFGAEQYGESSPPRLTTISAPPSASPYVFPSPQDEARLIAVPAERPPLRPSLDTGSATSIPIFHIRAPSATTPVRSPRSAGLHVDTDMDTSNPSDNASPSSSEPGAQKPALKSNFSAVSLRSHYSLSPGSAISSPMLAAMTDITPLPSPLYSGESPILWRRSSVGRPGSSSSLGSAREAAPGEEGGPVTSNSRVASLKKKRAVGFIPTWADSKDVGPHARKQEASHARNRSASEAITEQLHPVRPRNVTISTPLSDTTASIESLHREPYLAAQRGIIQPHVPMTSVSIPTPPPSNRSIDSEADEGKEEESFVEYLTVRSGGKKQRYRPLRPLGQGTFSKVVLATTETLPVDAIYSEELESRLDPKQLVAIKIVEHGPAGGADEERVILGLKREIEILRSISHPSLIHLRAYDMTGSEALLVLGYCCGGDLFDLASQRRDVLAPSIVQRMFAELVDAVRYLHSKMIVHRDIKLENVLLNVPPTFLATLTSPQSHPTPLITLTDLGLSRQIPQPPASPLLTTRCGSEDYAAPEILLSQPYDGRATDAWALGVLLYALMEGRLPFDPPPPRAGGASRGRGSRPSHRIARCEWQWWRFGDDRDGEWLPDGNSRWEGARLVVEGLLRKVSRGRWGLERVAEEEWVRGGIRDVEGGLSWPGGEEAGAGAEMEI